MKGNWQMADLINQTIEDKNGILVEAFADFIDTLKRVRNNEMPIRKRKHTKKYKNSRLTKEQKDAYLQKIKDSMTEEQLFLQQKLTLHTVADQLGIPSHHVSQVINEKLQQNFFDFINAYRVAYVKEILSGENLQKYTSTISY